MKIYVDAEMNGIKFDGVTDNSETLRSILDSVSCLDDDGHDVKLVLSPGKCVVRKEVVIRLINSDAHLEGLGDVEFVNPDADEQIRNLEARIKALEGRWRLF